MIAGVLGAAAALIMASESHERVRQKWHQIHMYRKHRIAEGLKDIHHGLYDIAHADKHEGLALIERGAEYIQRAAGLGFPRHDLFHPHPKHRHE